MVSAVIFNRLIRFVHWGIAPAVFLNLFILESGEYFHRLLGYSAALLVVIRLAHGLVTRNHRQFPNIIARITYLAIWLSIFLLAITGFLMGTDAFWGDDTIEESHELISLFLQILIVLHLSGIAHDSYINKRRTWLNMINGKKN